ncbi:polymorphic toxin-type HINT domain-containing protein [Sinosporangium siamense]|uniref:Hint domain-containing protein n=1 Tax=Sinosporangium siamense TaxID=1367973 RepID=A0A919RDJ0_9ACTN|nr:polymorphic toxin-type HINT domain-containing protein [Sinosporangium siamense]GII91903.1 hypothetical protein Ssi02_21340 [Sinosporangium siamense]
MRRLLSGTGAGAVYTAGHSYEDGLGRTRETQTESPQGGRAVTVTAYDGRGLITVTSGPAHNGSAAGSGLLNPTLTLLPQWAKTEFDGLERPTAVIDYHLSTELRRTTHAYPGANRVETTPPVGGKNVTVTDAAGQTVKKEEWKDAVVHHDTAYAYDHSGNLTSVTDARGNVRTFTYDWLQQRTAATDPDAGSSSTGYDAAGRPLWSIDGTGAKVSTVYDELGRRTSQWSGEPNTGTKLAEWVYDTVAYGHLTSATRYAGGNAYTDSVLAYDHAYRPTSTRTSIPAAEGALAGNYDFSASFDKAGNMTGYGMPAAGGLSAENLTLTYTGLGLPKGLTSNLGGTTTYVKDSLYTATGRLSERSYGSNGQVKRDFTWNEGTGYLTRLTTTAKADTATPTTAQDDQFTYNAGGEITRILDAASAAGGSPGQSECFTYDGLHRLTQAYTTRAAACGGGADYQGVDPYRESYGYDETGNITSRNASTHPILGYSYSYTYPTTPGAARPNAVTQIDVFGSGSMHTDTYAYDNAGRLTASTVASTQSTYAWNALGQLESATVAGQSTSMVYDTDGERLIRRDPGGTTLYLGSMELRLASGTVTATRYYNGPDGSTVALRSPGTLKWLASGLHGTTQLAIDDTPTAAVSRERYLPYGKRRGTDDLPFTDRGFLGKTEDGSTGLTYLGARYYDPVLARFISTDPLLVLDRPQWMNPYAYAGNNPIGLSDPDGLAPRHDDEYACTDRNSKRCKAGLLKAAKWDARQAQLEMNRQWDRLVKALKSLGKILMDELGVTAGIECLTKFSRNACFDTMLNVLSSLAGGVIAKIARKFILPTEWAAAGRLAKKIGRHLTTAVSAFKGWWKATDRLKAARVRASSAQREFDKACKSSFVPGTVVVMADGTRKPIENIEVGDKVLATDPKTGKTGAKAVTALISSKGAKNLVQITVAADGKAGSAIGVITATDNHPFWLQDRKEWVEATSLPSGAWLQNTAGASVKVVAIAKWSTQSQRVHNLTVDDIHTYYVRAGSSGILVHNSDPCNDMPFGPQLHYEANPKHANGKLGSRIGPEPTNAQAMLNRSLHISVRRRVAYDRSTGEIIVFAQTRDATWHGYVVTWNLLDQTSRSALIKAKIFKSNGKLR